MKSRIIMIFVLSLTTCIPFTSCTKENGSSDNTGIEFRMRSQENGGDIIELLWVNNAYQGMDGYTSLSISSSNNFRVFGHNEYCRITCVGSVNGLGEINDIPQTGWAGEIAVNPGNGYVIQATNIVSNIDYFCRYARVYVEDWIESTSGGIIGAVIRYEDNWKIEE